MLDDENWVVGYCDQPTVHGAGSCDMVIYLEIWVVCTELCKLVHDRSTCVTEDLAFGFPATAFVCVIQFGEALG